jgi:[acyl-carrier-protein] S-malonyltransferase
MSKTAFVFSGQGAQFAGMGKELCLCSKAAEDVFKTADTLRPGTSEQCFTADKETLSKTLNTQPCLFAADLAAAGALREAGVTPDCLAGFSLGEIPALAFGGYLTVEDAFTFVCARAKYMDECARKFPGAMFAVLKLSDDAVAEIASEVKDAYPVNYNCDGQMVVACGANSADILAEKVRGRGGKAVRLAVSGAFHSPFMDGAAQKLRRDFKDLSFKTPEIPVYANVTADIYTGADLLFRQVNSPVLWKKTIHAMRKAGVGTFIEVGAGKTLCGLISKTVPDAVVLNVEDKKSLDTTLEVLGNANR